MFKKHSGKTALAAAFLIALAALIAGCGGGSSTASEQEIAKAKREGRIERAEKEKERELETKLRKLEKENREAKRHHRKDELRELKEKAAHTGSAPPSTSSGTSTGPSGTECGSGTIAGPETSCGFAQNVRAEYENYVGSGNGYVEAWSEANEEWYDMYCVEGSEHECSGAISATVYWP